MDLKKNLILVRQYVPVSRGLLNLLRHSLGTRKNVGLNGCFLFPGIRGLVAFLDGGGRLQMPALCPPEIYTIMTECWNIDPMERPTFEDLKIKLIDMDLKEQIEQVGQGPQLPRTQTGLSVANVYVNRPSQRSSVPGPQAIQIDPQSRTSKQGLNTYYKLSSLNTQMLFLGIVLGTTQ